jgi:tetratricopeptide (TPR) repeat protein
MITASLALLLCADIARADPATDADRLFLEGRELYKAGKYDEACAKFERAYELDKGPGIVANLADCRDREGAPAEAWRLFRDAAARWDNAAGAKLARERAEKLAKRLAIVVIGVPDPGLAGLWIAINGRRVAPASEIRDAIMPGELEIVAKAPGRPAFRRTRTAAAGEKVVVELAFGDAAEPAPPAPPATGDAPAPRAGRERRRGRVRLAIGLGAVGVAGIATGVGLGFYASGRYDSVLADAARCPDGELAGCDTLGKERLRDALRFADAGTGIGIAGGVLAAAAVIVYVTAPLDLVAAPMVGDRTAGLSLARRF